MKPRKTWTEKLEKVNHLPKMVPIPLKMRRRLGKGKLVVPAPSEVDEVMRRVPRGKLIIIHEIRAVLARKHGIAGSCPIVTGIGAWLAAHASEEQATLGKKRTIPWWRTLKTEGTLYPKLPGGIHNHKKLLEAEGYQVGGHGNRWWVESYEKKLWRAAMGHTNYVLKVG